MQFINHGLKAETTTLTKFLLSTFSISIVQKNFLLFWIIYSTLSYSITDVKNNFIQYTSIKHSIIISEIYKYKETLNMAKVKKYDRKKSNNKKISNKQVNDAWSDSLEVTLRDDSKVSAISLNKKTPIHCPFHDDGEHSAFVGYSDKSLNHFISCSAEHTTYWKVKDKNRYSKFAENYWSYGTDYFEFGFTDLKFFYEKIGLKKIHILANADSTEDKNELTAYLVKNKHIRHIESMEYLGDHSSNTPFYTVDSDKGIVSVHHPMISSKIIDNAYIEDYLASLFGPNKEFMKQWMAVYTYTNYRKLPTLIFTGPRGTGKSTFAELLMEIYKPLSTDWEGVSKNFNYEFENKLLVVEENDRDSTDQYKIFKSITGQRENTVNKKFKDPFRIKNNANLILLSNEPIPMYVKKEELPTDPKNNQFFVYEFSPLNTPIDAQLFQKLVDRLGNYCKTELLNVFSQLQMDDKRYSIEVPITDAEKALFESNVTEIDSENNDFIDFLNRKMLGGDKADYRFSAFIENGFLPTKAIKNFGTSRTNDQSKIKNLIKRGFIEAASQKKMIDGHRESCYTMTKKLIDAINNSDADEIIPKSNDDNNGDNNDDNTAACPVAV